MGFGEDGEVCGEIAREPPLNLAVIWRVIKCDCMGAGGNRLLKKIKKDKKKSDFWWINFNYQLHNVLQSVSRLQSANLDEKEAVRALRPRACRLYSASMQTREPLHGGTYLKWELRFSQET